MRTHDPARSPTPPRIVLADGSASRTVLVARPGTALRIGREAPVLLGAEPRDGRVSRVAVEVTSTSEGWFVHSLNRNGVLIHPWGLPSWLARPTELLTSSRVALRVLGEQQRRHWVLLEDDGLDAEVANPGGSILTDVETRARPLTAAQLEVVAETFGDLLSWPPVVPSEPRQLKQVARRLGISVSGVQARLNEVRTKADSLGLSRVVALSDPEYVYVLVRAGYLQPPGS